MGWESGQIVAERYRLEEPIGKGGMGMVWRAEHIKLKSPVAIKVLPQRVAEDDTRSARFIREAQAAAAIRSTNVVQVLDYGVDDGVAYIAMEYLEGESLADRLDRRTRLGPRETLTVITQVAKAMSRAHKKGIIHRDLKPGNIFLSREDDGEVVKVLDFGIAKLTDKKQGTDQTTQTGYLLGTPNYMSPEQTRGHRVVDQRADVWSLGIVAFECLCGERPVDGETIGDIIYKICSTEMPRPSQVAPVPVGFDRWFRKATQKDPEKRFQSAKAMAVALGDAMGDDVPFSQPESFDSFDRVSIELSDTLAAKRASEAAPDSMAGEGAEPFDPNLDSRDQPTIDSLALDTKVSGPPPDSRDERGEPDADKRAVDARSADGADVSAPTTMGESLRGAAALTRTAATSAPPPPRRRLLLAAGTAATVAVALLFMFGRQEHVQGSGRDVVPSAAGENTSNVSDPATGSAGARSAQPTSTARDPNRSATTTPSATVSASAAASSVPTATVSSRPQPPRVRPNGPLPPRPPPPADPAPKPSASGSDKIDFGI